MSLAWRLKLLAARARRRRTPDVDREELVRRHAPGRSFADVGCMWGVHGRIAFLAEEAGATEVTGVDLAERTPEFRAEHERRGSRVRFVRGDMNDAATAVEVGPHEVVFCSGVLYHSPNPMLTLERLRELTTHLLILQTTGVPELPGVEQGAVFYPGIRRRGIYRLWGGDPPGGGGSDAYTPWWWGLSPSALRSMLRAVGFEPQEEFGSALGRHVLAKPVG